MNAFGSVLGTEPAVYAVGYSKGYLMQLSF